MASVKSVFLFQRAGCLFAFLMVVCSLPSANSSDFGYIPFVNGRTYYKLHTVEQTWEEAKSKCANEGGRLAMIDTLEKIRFVAEMRATIHKVWIGVYRTGSESPWYGVGYESPGNALTHLPWVANHKISDHNCACIQGFTKGIDLGVANYQCTWRWAFVCEKDSIHEMNGRGDNSGIDSFQQKQI